LTPQPNQSIQTVAGRRKPPYNVLDGEDFH
jgi:hypothetical protein